MAITQIVLGALVKTTTGEVNNFLSLKFESSKFAGITKTILQPSYFCRCKIQRAAF